MIKWFRNAAPFDKYKTQVAPVKTPKVPRIPKSTTVKKVKKTFKGPKSPEFYKRKLYVPQPFIHAYLNKDAGHSDNTMNFLHDIEEFGRITYIQWKPSPRACEKCDPNLWPSNGIWRGSNALGDFLDDMRSGPGVDPGLYSQMSNGVLFHNNCSCELLISNQYGQCYRLNRGGYEATSNAGEVPTGKEEAVTPEITPATLGVTPLSPEETKKVEEEMWYK